MCWNQIPSQVHFYFCLCCEQTNDKHFYPQVLVKLVSIILILVKYYIPQHSSSTPNVDLIYNCFCRSSYQLCSSSWKSFQHKQHLLMKCIFLSTLAVRQTSNYLYIVAFVEIHISNVIKLKKFPTLAASGVMLTLHEDTQ